MGKIGEAVYWYLPYIMSVVAILGLVLAFILLYLGWPFFILDAVVTKENVDENQDVLDDKFWSPRAQCAEFNSVFKISDEDWNCPLEPCVRLNTTSGTLVDKCTCTWNNHTVYRYCRTMLIFYDYVGGLNETNLLSVN